MSRLCNIHISCQFPPAILAGIYGGAFLAVFCGNNKPPYFPIYGGIIPKR
ncbi:putative membrane protein [Gluconacetobacter diazotrophicus PA1 5]|uniref:Putative membrane protein n=1 Tax=Gluconacetobacter diazotrophicus (strain ATCC 49037 / DSM 5601 / CCUG 37298 / CIP 103539 / LMG 7603 / PAl5) TaxID=272568 RepID=A9HCU8_GLUDA|nr:putative membrane protein [Gluconacetobacter diazotrophicus PA1 5]